MTPERWKLVDQLLLEALERVPAERVAFISEACGSDDDLRHEIESLIVFHERAENFIEAPPTAMAADWLAAKESQAGQTIGHYHLIRQIGRGGMGDVYLAHDTQLGRPIALKLLQTKLTQDTARVRRFRQEARAASALNHPNILTIYEVGKADLTTSGAHFIAAEFVDGQTLRELCRGAGLALGTALDILIQVAAALSAAHEAGIVHRDIKPENLMLRRDGLVKVLDFGLAKLTEAATRPHHQAGASFTHVTTQPGVVMGTVSYMSPEQARGLEVDERSDLFSLGVVMYELLTGHAPFEGETTGDVLVALLGGEPRPLARYVAKLPEALQEIINRTLAKPVEQRYQTARALGADLKQLKDDLEFAAKLKGQAGSKDDILALTVGAAMNSAELSTFDTRQTAEPLTHAMRRMPEPDLASPSGRARFAALSNRLRQRSKVLAAALVVVISAAVLGWQRFAPGTSAIDSVAILPFTNVGNDPQTEYLPDGLTESLIDRLSQLPALRVSAGSTVFSYKGREVDPRQAGKELQVRALVTGRVAWQGEKLIIRAELVDTADGARLWGDEFQHTHSDIVTAQEEIAREIAVKLRRRLSPDSQQQLAKRHSTDGKAYELYQQGRYLYRQYRRSSQQKALDYFGQAIALNPRYALAYCGIADVYADFSGQYMPPSEAIPMARRAALKAIELDETLSEAHHSLALVKLWGDWDWAGAEREFKRALELNPNLVLTRIYYAEFLSHQKRFEEALREVRRAEASDPVSIQAMGREANIHFLMRQYDRAIAIHRKILDLSPNSVGIQLQLGVTLSQQGLHQEALAQVSQLQIPALSHPDRVWLAYIQARAGQRDEPLKLLRKFATQPANERVPPLYFAIVHLGLGHKEQALAWLVKCYEERSDHVLKIGADPIFDPLRSDPRFDELLRDIGLTP